MLSGSTVIYIEQVHEAYILVGWKGVIMWVKHDWTPILRQKMQNYYLSGSSWIWYWILVLRQKIQKREAEGEKAIQGSIGFIYGKASGDFLDETSSSWRIPIVAHEVVGP